MRRTYLEGLRMGVTERQRDITAMFRASDYVLLYGGSRSGKTLHTCKYLIQRARSGLRTRHLIIRNQLKDARQKLIKGSIAEALDLMGMRKRRDYQFNGVDNVFTFTGGGQLWVAGASDEGRKGGGSELGSEFTTICIDEVSEVDWGTKVLLETRLAETRGRGEGRGQSKKMIFICNPPQTAHWTYKVFFRKEDPVTQEPLRTEGMRYGTLQVNPKDNPYLDKHYLRILRNLSGAERQRFLEGEFQDESADSIFGGYRYISQCPPRGTFDSVVIGVDPAGTGKQTSDRTGIVVVGRIGDIAYVIADLSERAKPEQWASSVAGLARHYRAAVVAETNYGGDMVVNVLRQADRDMRVVQIKHQKSKHARALPVAQKYKNGEVVHVGEAKSWMRLEDELAGFNDTSWVGSGSPDRADAMFMAMSHAFGFGEGMARSRIWI